MKNKKYNKCIECGYISTDKNIGDFICKKCKEKENKHWNKWFIFLAIISGLVYLSLFEVQAVSLMIGFCLGFLINLKMEKK